jgi:hypothetical protein
MAFEVVPPLIVPPYTTLQRVRDFEKFNPRGNSYSTSTHLSCSIYRVQDADCLAGRRHGDAVSSLTDLLTDMPSSAVWMMALRETETETETWVLLGRRQDGYEGRGGEQREQ